ncbi:hypothetical protein ACHAWF_009150, partial [Thalassiosira exigua]
MAAEEDEEGGSSPPPLPPSPPTLRLTLADANDDVLLRTFAFLGPRRVASGPGATCRRLRDLARRDALWRAFWAGRCMFPDPACGGGEEGGDRGPPPHGAALAFRLGLAEMGLEGRMRGMTSGVDGDGVGGDDDGDGPGDAALHRAYVQRHVAMRRTNLRPSRAEAEEGDYDLRARLCTQTWPGRLSLALDRDGRDGHVGGRAAVGRRVVTCLNPAEAWCDAPGCPKARCGPRGCLRCYRFLPREYGPGANPSRMARECSARDYVSFVRCSWCTVSFCSEHVEGYYKRTTPSPGCRSWYECDECQRSSCPDCVGQVFLRPPGADGCAVVTAGKRCGRRVCAECVWRVGRRKPTSVGNVPGGDYKGGMGYDVITVRG